MLLCVRRCLRQRAVRRLTARICLPTMRLDHAPNQLLIVIRSRRGKLPELLLHLYSFSFSIALSIVNLSLFVG